MIRARRRIRRAWNPWLAVVAAILIAAAAVLVDSITGPTQTVAVAGPVQYRDWPVYIPTTPQSCRDAMAAADEMYWKSIETDAASLAAVEKLRTAKTLADVAAAKKANEKAKRAAKLLASSRRALLDQYVKCRDAK